MASNQKRLKEEEDRISHLSDSLLHQILSFLNTQQVVQTCVLSKRWKTMWTSVPTLNFYYTSYEVSPSTSRNRDENAKPDSFRQFIMLVLSSLATSWSIKKLTFSSPKNDGSLVKMLFRFAASHHIEELSINAAVCIQHADYSCCLLTCRSLRVYGLFLDEWSHLKSCALMSLKIGNKHSAVGMRLKGEMFSSCDNLESLVLSGSVKFSSSGVNISAPKLKYLGIYLSSVWILDYFTNIVLATPKLRSLKLRNVIPMMTCVENVGYMDQIEVTHIDGKFVENATVKQRGEEILISLFRLLQNAKSLSLSLDVAKAMCFCLLYSSMEGEPKLLENVRHLRLMTCKRKMAIPDYVLNYLLKNAPLTNMVVEFSPF